MWSSAKPIALVSVSFVLALTVSQSVVGTPQAAAKPTVKLGTIARPGLKMFQLLKAMAEQWRDAPGGGVDLQIFNPNGGEAAIVSKMRGDSSQLQAAMLTIAGLSEIDQSVTALEDLPFMFRSLDEVEYVRRKLTPDIEKRFLQKDFVVLFWGDVGWTRFFSRQEMVRPADLRKMKIFTWAGNSAQRDIMLGAGFNPVPLETDFILSSLQNRQIDVIPTSPVVANDFQFATQTKHMLEINYAPLVGGAVIKKKTWDALPKATQDALRKSAEETGRMIQLEGRAESDRAVKVMQEKQKLIVHPATPAIEAEWQAVAETMLPKIRGGLVPADLYDRAIVALKEYRAQKGVR